MATKGYSISYLAEKLEEAEKFQVTAAMGNQYDSSKLTTSHVSVIDGVVYDILNYNQGLLDPYNIVSWSTSSGGFIIGRTGSYELEFSVACYATGGGSVRTWRGIIERGHQILARNTIKNENHGTPMLTVRWCGKLSAGDIIQFGVAGKPITAGGGFTIRRTRLD